MVFFRGMGLSSCLRAFVVASILASGIVFVSTTRAQQPIRRPMSILDLVELPRMLDPQLSPDGRSVIYTVTRADWKANLELEWFERHVMGRSYTWELAPGDASPASGPANAR